jgi:hypothetical protein
MRPALVRTLQSMVRFIIIGGVVAVAFTIYALVDVLMTERSRVRGVAKPAWALITVILPVIGGVLWLTVGKAKRGPRRVSPPVAPDDDPNFLSSLSQEEIRRRAEQDERLRRLEQELADLEAEDDDDDDTPRAGTAG